MFRVLYHRDLLHITIRKQTIVTHFNDLLLVGVLHQNQNPHLRFISNIPESTNPHSFTVDYLVNKCGLPPQKALSAAKNFRLCSIEKADSVISLFESYGLTKTYIAKLISQKPDLLLYDYKNLKPKFEFLCDLGVSGPIHFKFIVSSSSFLSASLQNQIIPSYNLLKSYIHSPADILAVFKRCSWIFQYNLEKTLIPNISILQAHGVPDYNISKILVSQPRTLTQNSDRFKEIVGTVKKIGLNPSSTMFSRAVGTMAGLTKSSWERKLMVYRELGWSDDDILSAFKRQPLCMKMSEEKIRTMVEFFSDRLKWKPSEISSSPSLLLFSLEKRIIPWCAVLEILYSKGIIRKKLSLGAVLKKSERHFLKTFVTKYQETLPELMKAYQGEIEFAGFGDAVWAK